MPRRRWSEKRRDDLAGDLDILLGDLCVIWGFCNRLTGTSLVQDHPCLTGDLFATAVLTAEGWTANHHGDWHARIARVFCGRYGRRTVSQADFMPLPRYQNAAPTRRNLRKS
jgi:hypothetical protein